MLLTCLASTEDQGFMQLLCIYAYFKISLKNPQSYILKQHLSPYTTFPAVPKLCVIQSPVTGKEKYPYLPHGLCMLSWLGTTLVAGLGVCTLQVVDGHVAIIEAHCQEVGVVTVEVQAHDTTLTAEGVLWEGGVLQGVEQEHAMALLHEVI